MKEITQPGQPGQPGPCNWHLNLISSVSRRRRPLIPFCVLLDVPEVHVNGADPDISRQTAEGLELKSEAALPDVVKVPSGLNENWER